jgi:YggT family protein
MMVLKTLLFILDVAYYVILIHVILSWLINFQVLNLRQPLVAQFWFGLNRLLEPLYSRIRGFLPRLNGFDLAPLVVFIAIILLQRLLVNNQALFL